MKARIDSKAKTIAIEEPVLMDELLKFVKFIAPNDWKTWKVETNVKFEFTSNPIVIHDYSRPWHYPYYYGTTPCGPTLTGESGTLTVNGADWGGGAIASSITNTISQARQDGPTWSIEHPIAYIDVKGV